MKEKIFAKLKQEFSHLGLGDVILNGHAEALAATGLVTDDNIDTVVSGQKGFLETLQKSNDARVTDAVKKARKEAEDEAKKKAEEAEAARKKAEEEAKKKADEEAAKKKAEEEAEAKRLADEQKRKEELEKNNDIPQWFKDMQAAQEAKAKEEREAYEARIAELTNASTSNKESFEKLIKELTEKNTKLQEGFDKMTEEANVARAEKARRERSEMILAKAKELGISQSRIDEGFAIADDADEGTITTYLSKVATNAKAHEMPAAQRFAMTEAKPSDDEIASVANLLVK